MARGWMSLAGAMGGHSVVARLITMFGTDEQKQRWLPQMATGEARATMALTEPAGVPTCRPSVPVRWRPAASTASTG
jgi:alkylation response protein AidB-like acyl-CoA dehydrogenase